MNKTFLKDLSNLLYESLQTTESLGRSIIVEKDRILSKIEAKNVLTDFYVCDDNIVRITFALIPKEALDYLRYKSLIIVSVEDGELRASIKEALIKAMKGGENFKKFKQRVDTVFDNYGVTNLKSNHIQTVFKTNLNTAYSVGQLEQVYEMRERFPFWKYIAIRDNRTRSSHLALDGKIFKTGEGPLPPIDYNCRCTAIYLHISQTAGIKPEIVKEGQEIVKFTARDSFEEWQNSKEGIISSVLSGWIDSNLP